MMSPRQLRGTVLAALLCSALAGCGSVSASSATSGSSGAGGAGATSSAATMSAAASSAAAPPADAVGCAAVDQATSVTVHRVMHLVEPTRMGALTMTRHDATLVRALFGQFCAAVAHAETAGDAAHCPAELGTSYTGTFYDGSRPLATFVYGASGCQTLRLTADGKTQFTMVFGTASAAAPKLVAAMAAVLGEPVSMLARPQTQVNQNSGPNK